MKNGRKCLQQTICFLSSFSNMTFLVTMAIVYLGRHRICLHILPTLSLRHYSHSKWIVWFFTTARSYRLHSKSEKINFARLCVMKNWVIYLADTFTIRVIRKMHERDQNWKFLRIQRNEGWFIKTFPWHCERTYVNLHTTTTNLLTEKTLSHHSSNKIANFRICYLWKDEKKVAEPWLQASKLNERRTMCDNQVSCMNVDHDECCNFKHSNLLFNFMPVRLLPVNVDDVSIYE